MYQTNLKKIYMFLESLVYQTTPKKIVYVFGVSHVSNYTWNFFLCFCSLSCIKLQLKFVACL